MRLLTEHDILIKDLTAKIHHAGFEGEYVRIAVRDEKDNQALTEALKKLMN
jgi:histidinol-phosphate/aromatic aminotransferase/cobyric acid decarboxylase-like protein